MKRVNGIIRIISFLIDGIIIAFPVILIMLVYFQVSGSQVDLLYKLLFAVYGTLFMEYMKGATIGKFIGKIKVITVENTVPTLVQYGMRELIKTMYFIPIVGWGIVLISTIMLFIGDGRAIHDRIANTKVIYIWNLIDIEDEMNDVIKDEVKEV